MNGDAFADLWAYVTTYLNMIDLEGGGRYQVARYGNDDGKLVVVEMFDGEPQVIHRAGLPRVFRGGEEVV